MTEKEILLTMTVCQLLGKPVHPAAVVLQFEHAQQVLAEYNKETKKAKARSGA
jgi:hypothetical protein